MSGKRACAADNQCGCGAAGPGDAGTRQHQRDDSLLQRASDIKYLYSPGTRRRRVLWALNGLLVGVTLLQWCLVCFSACGIRTLRTDCESELLILQALDLVKASSAFVCSLYVGLPRLMRSMQVCGFIARVLGRKPMVSPCSTKSGEWTLVASRGVFAETLRKIRGSHSVVLAVGMAATGVGSTVLFAHALVDFTGSRSNHPGLYDSCGSDEFCAFLVSMMRVLWSINGGTLMILAAFVLLTPLQLWGPAAREALKQTEEHRVARLLDLPRFAMLSALWNTKLSIMLTVMEARGAATAKAELYYFYAASLLGLAIHCCLTKNCSGISFRSLAVPVPKVVSSMSFFNVGAAERNISPLKSMATIPSHLSRPAQQAWDNSFLKEEIKTVSNTTREPSLRFDCGLTFQHTIFLILNPFFWLLREVAVIPDVWTHIVIWIFRVIFILVAIFWCKDPPADFDVLEETGAGFGLVVNAKQLRAALLSHIDSKGLYPGQLETFSASTLRMRDTISVSYRWQDDIVDITNDVSVNMSLWQMRALADVLGNSNVRYVWLDKLSVPQQGHRCMKKALLARMMAVYAVAGWTLVLRSREQPTSRYHQRVWTLQEFCVAPHLTVVTEEDLDGPESDVTAVGSSDEEAILELRSWFQVNPARLIPFWLSQGVKHLPAEELQYMYERFRSISAITYSSFEEDRLRAFYPLVAHCPVENQKELSELVKQICSVAKAQEPRLERLQTVKHSIRPRRSVDEPDDNGDADEIRYLGVACNLLDSRLNEENLPVHFSQMNETTRLLGSSTGNRVSARQLPPLPFQPMDLAS